MPPPPSTPAHLVRRWVSTVKPPALQARDLVWVRSLLSEAEFALWQCHSPADQAHSIRVARLVEAGPVEAGPVEAGSAEAEATNAGGVANATAANLRCVAGLLHDIGKVESPASATARVLATLLRPFVPERLLQRWQKQQRERAKNNSHGKAGQEAGGLKEGIARLLNYPAIGAELLTQTNSHPQVVAWAAEHHLAPQHWTVDYSFGCSLQQADKRAT